MRFDYSQSMKLGQSMKLAPRVIQSMEILQLSMTDLEERIEQELENNVALEVAEPGSDEAAVEGGEGPSSSGAGTEADEFARLDTFERENPELAEEDSGGPAGEPAREVRERFEEEYTPRARAGETDAKFEAMAAAPARSASLHDQLADQWSLTEVDPALKPMGALIIAFLDDDGALRTPLETIAERAPSGTIPGEPDRKPTVEELARALRAVQLFLEPAGVAARDARECLLLQLDALEEEIGEDESGEASRGAILWARTIVDHHLDDLMQNRLPRISEKAGLTLGQIKEALALLRRLSLSPARRLVNDAQPPIVPDVIVEYDAENDRYVAFLNDGRLPNLRLSERYARMAKDRTIDKKDREFLKTNLANAQWLIDAVQQRKRTLMRVVNVVIAAQREVFDAGMQSLRPLPMTQVAEQLGIHVATVSRAVADKYLQTPRGIMPLRKFFTGGTTNDAGEDVAWDAIKAALKDIIDAEDKSKPLSDDALAEELKKRGLDIARRTVAKYRDQLKIPPARLRKQF